MTSTSLPTPTLHTARLRLRPFDDADANDLFALHSSARVLRYWDAPRVCQLKGVTGFCRRSLKTDPVWLPES